MRLHFLWLSVAVTVGACAVPAAVTKYLDQAQPAVASVGSLGGEIFASCVRTKQYEFRGDSLFVIRDSAAAAACEEQRRAGQAVERVRVMLADYLKALAAVANDKKVAVDGSVDSLASAIKGQSIVKVTGPQVDAVGKVAAFLGNAALGRYRRKVLAQVIRAEDADVGRIVMVLCVAVDAYQIELDDEREAARIYYGLAIRQGQGNEHAAVVLLRTEWEGRLAELDRRQAAARAFRDSISLVAVGHTKLAQSLRSASKTAAQASIERFASTAAGWLDETPAERGKRAGIER